MSMQRIKDPLSVLRTTDRRRLFRADVQRLVGLVLQLNRTALYHNQLDALLLVSLIMERRSKRPRRT